MNYSAVYEYERREKRTNWYVEVLAQCRCGIVFSDICVFGYTYQRVENWLIIISCLALVALFVSVIVSTLRINKYIRDLRDL